MRFNQNSVIGISYNYVYRLKTKRRIAQFANKINEISNKVERYRRHSPAVDAFTNATKSLYDLIKNAEDNVVYTGTALPELIVNDFDEEQIWQQLELQNSDHFNQLVPEIAQSLAAKRLSFTADTEKQQDSGYDNEDGDSQDEEDAHNEQEDDSDGSDISDADDLELENFDDDSGDEISEDEYLNALENKLKSKGKKKFDLGGGLDLDSDASDEEKELEALLQKATMQEDGGGDGGSDGEDELFSDLKGDTNEDDMAYMDGTTTQMPEQSQTPGYKGRTSVVDDKFFKLSDMEVFLDEEDAKEMKDNDKEESSDSENEDQPTMFDALDSNEEDECNTMDLHYSDFFDPDVKVKNGKPSKFTTMKRLANPDDDESGIESDAEVQPLEGSSSSKRRKVTFSKDTEEKQISDEDNSEESESDSDDDDDDVPKSTFEQRKKMLKSQIREMEDVSLTDKPWQLSGETGSNVRPQNSLMEEDLDFDRGTRPAPVITEETTETLESIITQRIMDKSWDDVERKEKPKEDSYEYRKRIELDQEKSKMSLAEVYEKEYLNQQKKEEEEDKIRIDPAHETIKNSMQSLFIKLDALANYHFAPRPVQPEIKIITNQPSIQMEEVAPSTVSSVQQLAPEELQKKGKKEVKGDSELTSTDRKRNRREKKAKQKAQKIHREAKLAKLKPTDRAVQEEAHKQLKKKSKNKSSGITMVDDKNAASAKSSSAFFNSLQDEVQKQIHNKKKTVKTKAKKEKNLAATYKL